MFRKLLIIIIAILALDYVFLLLTQGDSGVIPVQSVRVIDEAARRADKSQSITLLSINMAHGRGEYFHQALLPRTTIRKQLTTIGQLIQREQADVVAMQEVDAPSWWSGDFSHTAWVTEVAGLQAFAQGKNVDGLGLHYGNAIASGLPIQEAQQLSFGLSFPTLGKGAVMATFTWPGRPDFLFDVVSLHLDFASEAARAAQLATLQAHLTQLQRPVIIAGDFNMGLESEALSEWVTQGSLTTWRPEDNSLVTFPLLEKRIDWIWVSEAFEIMQQQVLADVVSDHRVVKAVIRLR